MSPSEQTRTPNRRTQELIQLSDGEATGKNTAPDKSDQLAGSFQQPTHGAQWLVDQLLPLASAAVAESWKDGIIRRTWHILTGGPVTWFPGRNNWGERSLPQSRWHLSAAEQTGRGCPREAVLLSGLCFLLMTASHSPVSAAIHHLTWPLWPCYMSRGQWLPSTPLGFLCGLQRHLAA